MAEKTTSGRLVAAIGGIVLIISLFLTWVGFSAPDVGGNLGQVPDQFGQAVENAQNAFEDASSQNAFGLLGYMPFVFLLIGVLAIIPAAFDIFDLQIELPVDNSLVAVAGGAIALGGVLVVLDGPGSKIGVWLALAGSIAITVGGFLDFQAEDEYEYATPAYAPAPTMPVAPPPAQPQAPQQPPQPPQQPPQPPPVG